MLIAWRAHEALNRSRAPTGFDFVLRAFFSSRRGNRPERRALLAAPQHRPARTARAIRDSLES
jgi:hypothetical protein